MAHQTHSLISEIKYDNSCQYNLEMFLQASVCPQGGVCLSACWDTTPPEHTPPGVDTAQSRHPPEQTYPWEQTPPRADTPWSRHPPEQTPPQSRHPLEQTPPGADNPPGSRHPPGQTPPGADTPQGEHPPPEHTPPTPPHPHPPGETATAADGTHPTGMHSCCICSDTIHNIAILVRS